MPIIGVKRATSERGHHQTPAKKSVPASGLWSRFIGLMSGIISPDYWNQANGNGDVASDKCDLSSKLPKAKNLKTGVSLNIPCITPLHTPVLSELERSVTKSHVTNLSTRPAQSPLFTPHLLSETSKQHPVGVAKYHKVVLNNARSFPHDILSDYSPVNLQPKVSIRNHSVKGSQQVTLQNCSLLTSEKQLGSTDQVISMDQSISWRSGSKLPSSSINLLHNPLSGFVDVDFKRGRSHSVKDSSSTDHNPDNAVDLSPIGHIQQWINDFKDSYHSNRRDLAAQIDTARKYAKLQYDERQQLCDHRMEQLRKRFSSGLDINELLVSGGDQTHEMRLKHDSEEQHKVQRAFAPGPDDEELSCGFRIRLKRRDFLTLSGLHWLNDEVVNFYMSLIADSCDGVHSYSSFFYPKLMGNTGYSGVRRWTKKVDIFSKRLLLVPVHLGMHWCLATIDFSNKQISYYDSLKGNNPECLQALREYLVQEAQDKKNIVYNMSGWNCVTPKNIPGQRSGSDCGVYMCMYARHLARNRSLKFSQRDMPIIREHMALELLEHKLM